MEEFLKLENGLVVSFDWLSFTITTTSRYQDVIKLLGYSQDDFEEVQGKVAGRQDTSRNQQSEAKRLLERDCRYMRY